MALAFEEGEIHLTQLVQTKLFHGGFTSFKNRFTGLGTKKRLRPKKRDEAGLLRGTTRIDTIRAHSKADNGTYPPGIIPEARRAARAFWQPSRLSTMGRTLCGAIFGT